MQGPDYLYFFTDKSNRSGYVENGIVYWSAMYKPIDFTARGWLDIAIDNVINDKYFSLDRSLSIPFDAVEDGAIILKDSYYKYGPEFEINLVILKQKLFYDDTEYGYYYDSFYKGRFDLYNFNHFGPVVTINLKESGVVELIKARESQTQEIPIDVPEAMPIYMDGITLQQSATYLISNGALPNDLGNHSLQMDVLSTEAIQSIGAVNQERLKKENNPAILNADAFFLTTGSEPVQVTAEWDFYMLPQLSNGIGAISGTSIFLKATEIADNSLFTHDLQSVGGGNPALLYNHTQHFVGSSTFTVGANKKLMLWMSTNQNGPFTFYTYQNNGSFKIKYTYRHRITVIKALPPVYVFEKIMEQVAPGFEVDSTVLINNFNMPLTSGDALRGIAGSVLKINLTDFFKAYNVQLDLGLGTIDGVLRIEEKDSFIDYDNPIDIGEVAKLKCKPDTSKYFSQLKIGFQEQSYEDVNGRDEFNNTAEYATAVTGINKLLDMVSPVRGDCFGAEFVRINLESKTTTDGTGDNDIWMLHVEKNITPALSAYKLNRDLNSTVSGVLSPASVFNVYLSPGHALRRVGKYIRSCFYKMDNTKLVFKSTEKNREMRSDNPLIIEKADVTVGSFGNPYFTPNLLTFESGMVDNMVELLEGSAVRSFRGSYLGFTFIGIPSKIGIKDATRDVQEQALLSDPSNDLTQLINISE